MVCGGGSDDVPGGVCEVSLPHEDRGVRSTRGPKMEVLNKTSLGLACRRRRVDSIKQVVVHRNTVGKNALEIAEWYAKNPKYTGGKMPYHVVIQRDGTVEQAVGFGRVAPGAAGMNQTGIQITLVGDFRRHLPTPEQAFALYQCCKDSARFIGTVNIIGHTEKRPSAVDPDKECPGRLLNMDGLRKHVLEDFEPWDTNQMVGELTKRGWKI
jgi:hypothetical protein